MAENTMGTREAFSFQSVEKLLPGKCLAFLAPSTINMVNAKKLIGGFAAAVTGTTVGCYNLFADAAFTGTLLGRVLLNVAAPPLLVICSLSRLVLPVPSSLLLRRSVASVPLGMTRLAVSLFAETSVERPDLPLFKKSETTRWSRQMCG